jgi:predicted O-methyltransferase YrrM
MTSIMTTCKQAVRTAQTRVQRKHHLRGLRGIADIRAGSTGFDQTVEDIRNAGTNSLSHFRNGYAFEGGLRLQQNPAEFAALCTYLRASGPYATYLEIGAASGGTCRFLSGAVGFGQVYIIDDGQHPDARYQADNLRHVPNLRRFVGDSHSPEAVDFLRHYAIDPLDVILVDGDHSYGGAWLDAQLALKFSRPGTVLVFHDTVACRGVELVWLRCVREKLIRPLAEYVGPEVPLGIGVGEVL